MLLPRLTLASLLLATTVSFAGEDPKAGPTPEIVQPTSSLRMAYEIESRYAITGDGSTEDGRGGRGNVSEQEALFRAVLTPQWGEGPVFRLGVLYQRFSFSLPSEAVLPNTLQTTALVVGADFAFGQSWLVRVEAQPGVYSDFHDIDRGDINVPFQIGVTYIASASLQLVAAVAFNFDHQYPVIPIVGFRWHISGPWTINAILPNPRLEYEWSKQLTLFAGADVKSNTYRVSQDFGDGHGRRRKLNDAIVEYDELRLGGGLSWKAAPGVNVEIEAGYLPYREFNYHRAGLDLATKSGAAYGQVALSAKF